MSVDLFGCVLWRLCQIATACTAIRAGAVAVAGSSVGTICTRTSVAAIATAIAAAITIFATRRRRRRHQAVLSSQALNLSHEIEFRSCRRRCRGFLFLFFLLRFRSLLGFRRGFGRGSFRFFGSFANHAEELVVVAAIDRVAVPIHRFDQGLELVRGVPQAIFHAVPFRLHANLRLVDRLEDVRVLEKGACTYIVRVAAMAEQSVGALLTFSLRSLDATLRFGIPATPWLRPTFTRLDNVGA